MTDTSTHLSPTPREQLRDLIAELAIVHGKVTLSSGKEADYYVDLRRITLHHRAAPLVGHVLLDQLEEAGLGTAEVDAVGGLTLGADPIEAARAAGAEVVGVATIMDRDTGAREKIEALGVPYFSIFGLTDFDLA